MLLSAIMLAAGLSRRMGSDKLLMEYKGETLLQWALLLLRDLPADERIVITTEKRLQYIKPLIGIKAIINPKPEEVLSGSIRLGIENTTGTHLMFLNADQPLLQASDLIPMINISKNNCDKIIYPLINGMPCTPTIFPALFRKELLSLKGDIGGRAIRDTHQNSCLVYKPKNPEMYNDIDNADDFGDLSLA